MNLNGIIDFLKLKPKYYFIFSIVSGVILFIPSEWKGKMGVDIKGMYLTIIFVIFVLFSMMWLYSVGEFFFLYFKNKSKNKKGIKKKENIFTEKIEQLSNSELNILSRFYAEDKKILKLDSFDPVVIGMLDDRILEIVYTGGGSFYDLDIDGTPMRINESIKKYISCTISDKIVKNGRLEYKYSFTIKY